MISSAQVPEDKQKLEEILSRDEYTAYIQGEKSSFWEWVKPLWRKLKNLLPDIQVSEGTGKLMAYGIMAVALLVVVYAIYWFTKQIVRKGRITSKAYLPEDESIRSYDYYWTEALGLAASSNWREGVRYGFLALLFYLEDQDRIRVGKWKTNWEYASELAETDPSLADVFRESSLLFERIWYGQEAVTEDDYITMLDRVAQVVGKEGADEHA
ncbi:hypothetical protein D3C73_578360 [compost metagenome]